MKEASGEASMTVITIILIGVIAAVAIPLVNNSMENAGYRSACQSMGGTYLNGKKRCEVYNGSSKVTYSCSKDSNGKYTCGTNS